MNWSATALSTVSSDTEPTIVLNFDSAKYIFNVGENTNRAFLQSKRNWRKTRAIFLSSVGTQRASGLPGLLMTFADSGIGKLDVTGPSGLLHFIAAMRLYTFRDTLAVQPNEIPAYSISSSLLESDPEPVFKDQNITVYAIPVVPLLDGQDTSHIPETSGKRKRSPSPDSPSKRSNLDCVSRSGHSPALPPTNVTPSVDPDTTPIFSLLREANFSPSVLVGDRAQEWRREIIRTMLSGEKAPNQERAEFPGNNKGKGKGKDKGDASTEGTKGHRPNGEVRFGKEKPPQQWKSGGQRNIGHKGEERQVLHQRRRISADHSKGAAEPSVALAQSDMGSTSDKVGESSAPTKPVFVPSPKGFNKQLPPCRSPYAGDSNSSFPKPTLAYVVIGPRVRGKFDAKKAEELGIPHGRIRSELTRGKTVSFMVDDGQGGSVERIVRPEDCIGESEVPGAVLILDTPTQAHIPSLSSSFTDSAFFSKFRSKLEQDAKQYSVRAIFHLCGNGVLEDDRYKEFMDGFGCDVHHLVASREHGADPVTFTSAALNQLRLNQLDSSIFPIPNLRLDAKKDISSAPGMPSQTSLLRANTLVSIRPRRPPVNETVNEGFDFFHSVILSPTPLPLPDSTMKQFTAAKAAVGDHVKSGLLVARPGDDVIVTTLGTGSAVPSKYRNVSGTFVQIPKWGNILLDVGEGTWGQLVRQFGDDVWQVLRDLKCIFISHIHGDHHIGLAKILAMRRKLDPSPTEPLYLVTHRPILLYLREYSDIEDLGMLDPSGNGVIPVLSDILHWKRTGLWQSGGPYPEVDGCEPWMNANGSQRSSEDLCRSLGLERITTVDVFHRTKCYGLVLKHKDGWSLVFSGDTMPSHVLAREGQGATLLIHEATMADDQVEMARAKGHSTFGQAVNIGRSMNAENILLTHFSARYPKMPPSAKQRSPNAQAERGRREPVLALAFDQARIRIGDMWKLNHYLPAIEQSFWDTREEDDDEDTSTAIEVDVA